MNRTYAPENQYTVQNASTVREHRVSEAVLSFFDLLISFFSDSAVRATVRVFGAILCFFAFLFVISAVEVGSLSFSAGILSTLLLFAIAFFCVYRPKRENT